MILYLFLLRARVSDITSFLFYLERIYFYLWVIVSQLMWCWEWNVCHQEQQQVTLTLSLLSGPSAFDFLE